MKFFFSCLCIFFEFVSCVNSQTNAFQKIEYASFDVNSYRTKTRDTAYINLYFLISNNGHMIINNQDDYHNTHTYYSFQLTQQELKNLHSIFDKNQKLKSYLATTKPDENSMYAGSYDFYRVTYSDESIDSMCIIPPFMTTKFQSVYNFLDSTIYIREDRKQVNKFDIPTGFKNSLKSGYLKSNYLPEIKTLPSFKP